MRNFFDENIYFRIIMSLVSIFLLMFFCIVRLFDVSENSLKASNLNNGYTVEINDGRGNIFDCKGEKITGEKEFYYVVFLPCNEAILRFTQITYGDERETGLEKLRDKKPVITKSLKKITGKGIYSYKTYERYSANLGLEHIVGYLDDANMGVVGLEKFYNNILSANASTKLFFETSASGEFLIGSEPRVVNARSAGDLYITIDKDIQRICNDAAKTIKNGAIIVTEAATGKIRGMVSKPGFDVYNLEEYVKSNDSPFLNKGLMGYSVGSVFKPLIAATLLENSKSDFTYKCTGYKDILGIRFYCHNKSGHGIMNMESAVAQSCNTYFYSAATIVEPNAFTNLATALGFGKKLMIANGIYAAEGNITSLNKLEKSKANMANFAIGQGDILLSPLVLCNLYSAIANGGYYFPPTLVEGYTENGNYVETEEVYKTTVFSKNTADILKRYLVNTVEQGTGKNAKPSGVGAGGKTATAQTGRFENNKEVLNAWFCGFFPDEEVKYVAVVFLEGAESGSESAAPVFRRIAEAINNLN